MLCRAGIFHHGRARLLRALSADRGVLKLLLAPRTGAVGATSLAILVFGGCFFWWWWKRRRRTDSEAGSETQREPSTPDLDADWKTLSQPSRSSPQGSGICKDFLGNGLRSGLEAPSVDSAENGGVSPTSSIVLPECVPPWPPLLASNRLLPPRCTFALHDALQSPVLPPPRCTWT